MKQAVIILAIMLNLGEVIYGENNKESDYINIRDLTGHTGDVYSVAFNQNGMLASGSSDRKIKL